jgi:hypothetical protein
MRWINLVTLIREIKDIDEAQWILLKDSMLKYYCFNQLDMSKGIELEIAL